MFSFNLNDFILVWLSLLYEALPFVALGAILSGVVETYVSREAVARCVPRSRALGIVASAFLGLGFPMCECGIVPVVRRLMLKGVPVSCGITFMLAAPVVHPLVIASTLIAFRGQGFVGIALLRVGLGITVAVAVGLVIWRLFGEGRVLLPGLHDEINDHDGHGHGECHLSHGAKVIQALQTAAADFLEIGTFLVGGTAAAAVINSGFSREAIAPIIEHRYASVGGFMLLAILLNLCSEADAFVAASFASFSIPAKLSFLVLGPMLDIKLLLMYTVVFRRRAIVALAILMITFVFVLCVTGYEWMPQFVAMFPK